MNLVGVTGLASQPQHPGSQTERSSSPSGMEIYYECTCSFGYSGSTIQTHYKGPGTPRALFFASNRESHGHHPNILREILKSILCKEHSNAGLPSYLKMGPRGSACPKAAYCLGRDQVCSRLQQMQLWNKATYFNRLTAWAYRCLLENYCHVSSWTTKSVPCNLAGSSGLGIKPTLCPFYILSTLAQF